MTYKLLTGFKTDIGEDPIFSIRASISPLFTVVTWQERIHPLGIVCIAKGRDSLLGLNEKEYVAIATDRFRDYFNGKVSLNDLEEEYVSWEADTQRSYDKFLAEDLKMLSNEELQEWTMRINKLFIELAQRTLYVENVDYEKILSVVGEGRKNLLDTIWERATEAAFISFEGRRLKKLIELVPLDSKDAIRQAKFIFTDYFWTSSEADIDAALEDVRKNLSEKKQEWDEINTKAIDREKQHEAWVQTLDLESRKIAEYAQLVMRIRDLRKDPIAQVQAMCAEIGMVMLERAEVDRGLAPFVILYEYMKGVDHLVSIKKEIEARQEGCIYLVHPDYSYEVELCNFQSAIEEMTVLIELGIEKTDSLKGQIACKGVVRGRARVIFDPSDPKGFQPGDILITSMTRPEFVPIMKQAGAVVTNEGGITCHAAIISRELGIPCIIGTKTATIVFKDGDMVEVDAEKGVVRIIS